MVCLVLSQSTGFLFALLGSKYLFIVKMFEIIPKAAWIVDIC